MNAQMSAACGHNAKLRVQLASDLHLDMLARFPGWHGIPPNPLADLLVLAGDIGQLDDVVRFFGAWPVPVLWVAGNHEFYRCDLLQARQRARQLVRKTSIIFLDNDSVGAAELSRFEAWFAPRADRLGNLRVLGSTLWTDYRFFDGDPRRDYLTQRMMDVNRRLSDHRLIRLGDRTFTTRDALAEHMEARTWLRTELMRPFSGRTLVISHHGPHCRSVHPRYAGNTINCAFVSELPELLELADVWVHGHVHDSFRYRACGCEVAVNPRGYPSNLARAIEPGDLLFENSQFQPDLLIDV